MVKCGKGHEHESIDEVKACFGVAHIPNVRPENLIPQGPRPASPKAQQNAKRMEEETRNRNLAREGKPHGFSSHCRYCVAGIGDPELAHSKPVMQAPVRRGPSEKQAKWIAGLLDNLNLEAPEGWIENLEPGWGKEASQVIDALKNLKHGAPLPSRPACLGKLLIPVLTGDAEDVEEQSRNGAFIHEPQKQAPLPSIPAGHYAIPSLTGNNDLDFFRVDRKGDDGKSGRTFIKRVIGGHPRTNIKFPQYRPVLEAIQEQGIEASRTLYGIEIGQCWKCNRELTDEESRRNGIGPICAQSL